MLKKYNRKRNFAESPEPVGTLNEGQNKGSKRHFVIQKHNARRLHYDFRLETENGVLKSWAVPKGFSLNPKIKRLAVLTEDHPFDYLLFEGTIPEGNYGAGTVLVWDTGYYTLEHANEKFSDQFDKGKVSFSLQGSKISGKFSLIRTGRENQWLLIKYNDQFASDEDLTTSMPDSVLTQREKDTTAKETNPTNELSKSQFNSNSNLVHSRVKNGEMHQSVSDMIELQQLPAVIFPSKIKPMLATAVNKAFNNDRWDFEIKWDGVRAILFYFKSKGIIEIRSRTNKSISHRYPEIINAVNTSSIVNCEDSVVLDGEIVVLNNRGHPDFQSHQRRMNVENSLDIQHLSNEIPATFYIFDILYIDGKSLENLEFWKRREVLSKVLDLNQDSEQMIRISESFGGKGIELFENIRALNLEGIIAKNKHSKYLQGARTTDWLKIKNIQTQDCVVIGYTPGEGNRKGYFGSLLLAVFDRGEFVFVGHSGSGFDFQLIVTIFTKLQKIVISECAVSYIPYTNRDPVWVRPHLVIEVKFDGWTKDKIMRAPIFLRVRDDKEPQQCTLEKPKHLEELSSVTRQNSDEPSLASSISSSSSSSSSSSPLPSTLSSKALPSGPFREPAQLLYSSTHHSNANTNKTKYSFSNLDKVFWPKNRYHRELTKGDLIEYYDRVSDYLLPFLKDRPLSLSRYPNGINGKHFYQKNWDKNMPEFVDSVKLYSDSAKRFTNYLICNNKETLLWLANLGCIEIHPWYSRVIDYEACLKNSTALDEENCGLDHPDFVVFDLDPYIYSGMETSKEQEPEYSAPAFRKTVEAAQLLKSEIFDILKIKSYIKTSGKTGIHIFVPITSTHTYDQARSFAEIIGRILVSKRPDKITMNWATTKRRGKIFFDHNQNAKGKTLASVFSVRPVESAAISMPLEWEGIDRILPTDFLLLNISEKIAGKNDIKNLLKSWSNILEHRQDLARLLDAAG
jgi:bifunctional non-homologous end joining protein LigD